MAHDSFHNSFVQFLKGLQQMRNIDYDFNHPPPLPQIQPTKRTKTHMQKNQTVFIQLGTKMQRTTEDNNQALLTCSKCALKTLKKKLPLKPHTPDR